MCFVVAQVEWTAVECCKIICKSICNSDWKGIKSSTDYIFQEIYNSAHVEYHRRICVWEWHRFESNKNQGRLLRALCDA